jgi:hypothetical protein
MFTAPSQEGQTGDGLGSSAESVRCAIQKTASCAQDAAIPLEEGLEEQRTPLLPIPRTAPVQEATFATG